MSRRRSSNVGALPRLFGIAAAAAVAFAAAFGTPAVQAGSGFTDIEDSPFKADIEWLAETGITSGCSSTQFCPLAPVTRGQMASFLVRALDLAPSAIDRFTDDNGTTHENDINALAASGITSGCAPTLFCPSAPVTRGQMASFLVRGLGLAPSGTDRFTDDNGTNHENDINALAASGITSGCAATAFCPLESVTRGQMAAFLHRAAPFFPMPPANEAPVLQEIPGQAVAELGSLDVAVSASDPDGDVLTITSSVWPSAPWVNLTGTGSNRTLEVDPPTNGAGVYEVTITATDPDGLADTETLSLTVNRTPAYAGSEAFFAITKSSGMDATSTIGDAFRLTNNSGNSARINSVQIDVSTALLPNMVFDPAGAIDSGVAKCFTADGGAAAVGLTTDGSGAGVGSCVTPYSVAREGGYEVLTIAFDDFGPGETFTFSADVDPLSLKGGATVQGTDLISGLELTGTTVTVTFSNGDVRTVETFRTIDSQGGSQNSATGEASPGAPGIAAVGIVGTEAEVTEASQVIRVTAPAGSWVVLLQVEAGMYQQTVAVGAFEANTALLLSEFIQQTPVDGFIDFPVNVQRLADGAGYNHFVAVTSTPDRRTTSENSDVIVLKLAE